MTQMAQENPLLTRTGVPFLDLGVERRAERQATGRRARLLAAVLAAMALYALACLIPASVIAFEMRMDLARRQRLARHERTAYDALLADNAEAERGARLWAGYRRSRERREAWRDALPAAVARMPASVTLSMVETDGGSGAVVMTLRGSAPDGETLKRTADSLESSPFFAGVQIAETAPDPHRPPDGVTFKLVARIGGALSAGALLPPE